MISPPQVAVVTGAGAGAARAIAARFGKEGWRVALLSRKPGSPGGSQARDRNAGRPSAGDPHRRDRHRRRLSRPRSGDGDLGPDRCVGVNAAMATVVSPIDQMTVEDYRRVAETTFLGCVAGTLAALEPMRARNTGAIIQIGSALAYRAIPLQSALLRQQVRHPGLHRLAARRAGLREVGHPRLHAADAGHEHASVRLGQGQAED